MPRPIKIDFFKLPDHAQLFFREYFARYPAELINEEMNSLRRQLALYDRQKLFQEEAQQRVDSKLRSEVEF